MTVYALIVGINHYKSSPLKGCVSDAHLVRKHFSRWEPEADIVTLTATAPADNSALQHPSEGPSVWPTYDNLFGCMNDILENGKGGDHVYIHYSGHGTRLPSTSNYHGAGTTDQFALVLYDEAHGVRYFKGRRLAGYMKRMVDAGLHVTLVLDCCFSGSVMRSDNQDAIRQIPYDPNIDAAYPDMDLVGDARDQTFRDGRIRPAWLVDPKGYAILAACGPHEIAKELTHSNGVFNGIFTFFLVQALHSLRIRGSEITHRALYAIILAQVHAHWPHQIPMRFGDANFSCFGNPLSGQLVAMIPIVKTSGDDHLQLEAGEAHGIHSGDQFAIYPLVENANGNLDNDAYHGKVEASTVHMLTTDLLHETGRSLPRHRIGVVAMARLMNAVVQGKFGISLLESVPNREMLLRAAEKLRYARLVSSASETGPLSPYSVDYACDQGYRFLRLDQTEIPSLPMVRSDAQGNVTHLLRILDHIAAFKVFEQIENRLPSQAWLHPLGIHIYDELGEDRSHEGVIEVQEGSILTISFENFGNTPIYAYLFDLGPSWQIDNVLCEDGDNDFVVIPPEGECKEIELCMEVPESYKERKQLSCEDVLKVFITAQPTTFAPFLLSKLEPNEPCTSSTRGSGDAISDFIDVLSHKSRNGNSSGTEWTTRNFIVRTLARDIS